MLVIMNSKKCSPFFRQRICKQYVVCRNVEANFSYIISIYLSSAHYFLLPSSRQRTQTPLPYFPSTNFYQTAVISNLCSCSVFFLYASSSVVLFFKVNLIKQVGMSIPFARRIHTLFPCLLLYHILCHSKYKCFA